MVDGPGTEGRSSNTGFESVCSGYVSSTGCSPVRRWDLDSDPLDRESERGRADPSAAGLEAAIGGRRTRKFVVALIEERKDVTLDEMVQRLSVERQVKISRSALGAWLRVSGKQTPSGGRGERWDIGSGHDELL